MSPTKSVTEIFEELKRTRRSVLIDGNAFYVVEGDLLLTTDQLLAYAFDRAAGQAAADNLARSQQALIGITDDSNRIVRWKKGLVLTYCVRKDTFTTDEQYQRVVAAMRQATGDWEATCGVNFAYLPEFDTGNPPAPGQVLFDVRGYDAGGRYVAVSFFPNDQPDRRHIYIDPTFFAPNLGFNPAGVLRHELGHVLGFRHEQISSGAPAICPKEALDHTIDLTKYDPHSVMHYFCGDVGTRELAITEIDRQGSRLVYGPPDAEMAYFE
jgi:hypothetical protein